jgi:hypothetical protein
MAELTAAATTADACCTPNQQATCCEQSAKEDCCGYDEDCGCDARILAQVLISPRSSA